MTVERWIRLIAGTFVTLSLALGYVWSPYFLLFTLFVGLNLAQSSVTDFCPMEVFLRRLGVGASVVGTATPARRAT
jgi:DUF2892 family protein